jgi:ABC-type nickel/cobalt efflux system permease component RcnA
MPGTMIWRLAGIAGLVLGLGLLALWVSGGLSGLEILAQTEQKRFQNDLAAVLRALKAGEAGALVALLGVAFGYGVLHAAGPGHGKVVLGGYGVARRVALGRLALIALGAALVQATVAVLLVQGGIAVMGWGRAQIGLAEAQVMAPLAQVLLGLVGLWLVWRGLRGLIAMLRPACPPMAGSRRGPGLFRAYHRRYRNDGSAPVAAQDSCPDCGHRHGPTLQEVSALSTPREALFLMLAVGARPCSGALVLLVLTWQIGLVWAGIAGAYAMALGTGMVTVGVAALAVWAREGGLRGIPALARLRGVMPMLELIVGLAVVAYVVTLGAAAQ